MKRNQLFVGGFGLAAVVAIGLSAPAMAGGMAEPVLEPVIAPAPAPVAPVTGDWTGGYVGAQLGYGDFSVGPNNGNGALYGLRAGYDYDFGRWVLGAGVDYDWSNINLNAGAGSIDKVARLKLRAGADLGQTLVYATAGGAYAEATVGGTGYSDTGYFAGVGAEYMLNSQWSVGGEILAHRFDNFDTTGLNVDATTASLNANFRF
jgi:outer membrane immunogenic protein